MSEDLGRHDLIVVGGGIAGIALAGELAPGARVLVLERESQPAYHSSGRSAAVYIEPYSTDAIFALTRATLPFLQQPPPGFTDQPLLHERGYLLLAPPGQERELDTFLATWQPRCPEIREIDLDEAHARVPVLREGYASRAAFDAATWSLDTNEMLQGWLRSLRRHGGRFVGDAGVSAVKREGADFVVTTSAGTARAPLLVNAAGAWAGELARLAGASDPGLEPRRRSAVLVEAPRGLDPSAWPAVSDPAKGFYFKPEGADLMISPADATPSAPCDARPEELDLALAVDRAQAAADLDVRRFRASWAGLRTFTRDENPLFGPDPLLPGFYWCAGQGGVGFQTAAAAARWCAAELGVGRPPDGLAELGFRPADVAPGRLL